MDNGIIKYVVIENVTEAFVESLRAAGVPLSVHDELPTIEVLKEVEAPIPELAAKIIALINDEVQKESAKVADKYSVFETAFNSLKQIVEGAKPVEDTVADEIKE